MSSLWSEVRDAIRGTGADYTKIPLRKAVFLLSVPMVLELVLESTFAVVDIFFVARLGASAVATVGLTESYLFLLYSVATADAPSSVEKPTPRTSRPRTATRGKAVSTKRGRAPRVCAPSARTTTTTV